jgi:hypothetical protein
MGHGKGGEWERETSRILSEWLNPDDKDEPLQLWRSTQSGGWAARAIWNVGDLRPVGDLGRTFRKKFGVECKHHKEISFWGVFSHGSPDLVEWWDKISLECQEYDLAPLLVLKQNYYPALIGFPTGLLPFAAAERWISLPHVGLSLIMLDEWLGLDVQYVYEEYEDWKGE